MEKYAQTISDLNEIIVELEDLGLEKQAVKLHTTFMKISGLLNDTFSLLEEKHKAYNELSDMVIDFVKQHK